ncbi:MAG TPA: hypothetical protein VN903_03665 [Polyangia bacterium]|jgi:hypothetical protein|nr:hypothetical protein [Polyangia bacterium]
MASRLSDRLVKAGRVSADAMRAAIARQAVYGGALDTALLETDAIDETLLWEELGAASGLPMPEPALCENPVKCVNPDGSAIELDGAWSERARAVPVGVKNGALQVLCGEPLARAELDSASERLGVPFQLYIVPEVRLAAVRQAVFDRQMPPRLLRLFARVAGAEPVRRWQTSHIKPVKVDEKRGVEVLPRRTAPPEASKKVEEAAALPTAATIVAPAPPEAAASPALPERPATASDAAKKPTAVSKAEVAKLIGRLYSNEAEKARDELMSITKQDFGTKARRWEAWWEKHKDDDRVDWLFEGLAHKEPRIRASSEEELRKLTGEYFGYHYDLPRREREQARARWQKWWSESGRGRKT